MLHATRYLGKQVKLCVYVILVTYITGRYFSKFYTTTTMTIEYITVYMKMSEFVSILYTVISVQFRVLG
jgi:hypothetical protein